MYIDVPAGTVTSFVKLPSRLKPLASAAMISACGLLCLALYSRLTVIVTRLRQFQRRLGHE